MTSLACRRFLPRDTRKCLHVSLQVGHPHALRATLVCRGNLRRPLLLTKGRLCALDADENR